MTCDCRAMGKKPLNRGETVPESSSQVMPASLSGSCRRIGLSGLLVVFVILTGCHPILRKRRLEERNPTFFVFAATPAQIRSVVAKPLGQNWTAEPLFWFRIAKEDPVFGRNWKEFAFSVATRDSDSPFAREIFQKPGNAEDLYLHSFGAPLCESDVYSCGGRSADFVATFHLHLTRLDQLRTRVEVLTLEPYVICGSYPSLVHGPLGRFVDVPPTSIEEYRLLLAIGRGLGVKDMPPLRLPVEDARTAIIWTNGHN